MNALQRYERLRSQLADVADELDRDGHDELVEAALEAAETMRAALDENGIRHYRAWYRQRDAADETERELEAREGSKR